MTTNLFLPMKRFVAPMTVAVLMFTVLAACDSASAVGGIDGAESSLEEAVSLIALDLGLNAQESAALSASMAKFGDGDDADREPGFLWHVAAELQATLTDEQKERLFERLERAGDQRRQGQQRGMQQQRRGGTGMGGQQDRRGNALEQLGLSDEQKEAIKAIRESFKPQIEAVLDQRGTLTRAEIKEQLDALHEQIKTEVEGVLTDEQRAQLEELKAEAEARHAEREAQMQANREATRLVMIEVLELTDDQVTALEELRDSAEAEREAIKALIESGADRETVKAQVEAQREAHRAAMISIYDDTQYEIVQIHKAIAMRFKANKGQRGQGGRSGGRGQGGRPGQGGFGGQGYGGQNGVVNG